jgi:hypothetical protein
MERVAIKTTTEQVFDADYHPINKTTRTATVEKIRIRIPEIGEYGSNGLKITALNALQLQWAFSHGGNNPPQGTQSGTLVAAGTAVSSVDIGYNKSAGLLCRVVDGYLEIGI